MKFVQSFPILIRPPRRVLIVGFGSIGQRHFRNIRALAQEARIALLRHRYTSSPEGTPVFRTLEDAAAFEAELVILASPASHHATQAVSLLPTCKAMLIEKPLADSVESGRFILDAVGASDAKTLVGYNLRFLSLLQQLRSLIHTKEHGNLLRFEAHVGQHLSLWRPGTVPEESVSAKPELGGGVFRELSHEIDYALWICGSPQRVRGRANACLLSSECEDSVDIWIDFASGVQAALHMDMVDRLPRRVIRVICEHATLELDCIRQRLLVNENPVLMLHQSSEETYLKEIESVWNATFSEDAQPEGATCREAMNVLEVIEQARYSSMSDSSPKP
jgi:predicted dehydrogenase